MNAVKPVLPEGSTTVGAMIQTSHLKPSGLNEEVTATAELTEIEGRKLTSKLVQPTAKGWWEKVLTSATLWTGNVS